MNDWEELASEIQRQNLTIQQLAKVLRVIYLTGQSQGVSRLARKIREELGL